LQNKKPFISVILTSYNSEKFLENSINSVLCQTYKNLELIIIDDYSLDKSFKIINNFTKVDKRIKIFRLKKNSGTASKPRNLGVKNSRGKYICFLDADDVWLPNKLETQIKKIETNKILTSSCVYFKKNNYSSFLLNIIRQILQFFFIKIINSNHNFFYLYNPIILSSVMIEKKMLVKNKFIEDKELVGIEDMLLWMELLKKKSKISFQINSLVKIRRRQGSLHANYLKQTIKTINLFTKQYLLYEKFTSPKIFLLGIFAKILRTFIKNVYIYFFNNIKKIVFVFALLYLLIFYSPLFWYLGKPLLFYDNLKNRKYDAVVVFSGPGYFKYFNNSYISRYKDVISFINKSTNKKLYITGRLIDIPEQKIVEQLLIAYGIKSSQIEVIYKELPSTYENIKNLQSILKKDKIKNIVLITGPYHTKRSKIIWESFSSDIQVSIFKTLDWPVKNNFFTRSKNKKIIVYEYLALLYNKIFILK